MIIINSTKKTIFPADAKVCGDIFSKFAGLMFSKRKERALILKFNKEKTVHLHMFFVFYPIDVLFLDKSKIVVDKKENFKPFTSCQSKKKAMYAVEMPDGTIKKTMTVIGDKIKF